MDTGLVIIGLLYIALSIWGIAALFIRRSQSQTRRRGG